jgi:hypothetical protein
VTPGVSPTTFRVKISIGRKEARTRNGSVAPAEGATASVRAMKRTAVVKTGFLSRVLRMEYIVSASYSQFRDHNVFTDSNI